MRMCKLVIVIAVIVLLAFVSVSSQQKPDVVALADQQRTAYITYLETTAQLSMAKIDKFIADLAKIPAGYAPLDSLRTANGISIPAPAVAKKEK